MATQITNAVCDSSSVANFVQWGQAISSALGTFGWQQTTDTGQVNWTTLSSTGVVYEVWQPNDTLQAAAPFFMKITYYGDSSQNINVQLGTATDGSGNVTGTALNLNATRYGGPGNKGGTQYECDFSGAPGRFGAMMWRTGGGNASQFFGVERTLDTSGNPSSSGVTYVSIASDNNYGNAYQQTLLFGPPAATTSLYSSWVQIYGANGTRGPYGSEAFGTDIPWSPIFPAFGQYINPMTIAGVACGGDIAEGVTFTTTLYGQTRTYLPSLSGGLGEAKPSESYGATLMRFD